MRKQNVGNDLFSLLQESVEKDPRATTEYRLECLRLALSESLKRIRISQGVDQRSLAATLGVNQPWVSKLESPNNDHTFESIARYLLALNADISITAINNRSGINIDLASSKNDGVTKHRTGRLAPFITQGDDSASSPRSATGHWNKVEEEPSAPYDRKSIWVIKNVA